MGNLLVDERDQSFILHEMFEIEKLCNSTQFADHSKEIFDMALNEALKLATTELMPTNETGDQIGCTYDPESHSVKVPKSFHAPYKIFREGNWLAMCEDPDIEGQGFPLIMGTAASEIFYSGAFYIYGLAELTHGAAKLIEVFGDDEQKEKFMKKMYSGEWGGTMCLTESDAGSDVGAVKAKAVKNSDGSYSISGTKIFISAGEQDLTENIIHMVVARVEGDPLGTKGLSLFIVPKFLINEDGTLGERNDVYCSNIERKMGIHGVSTVTLIFGENEKCSGYLLGKQGRGMAQMFKMMNEQRLLVGLQALSMSSSAFLHAVDYTKNRIQGVHAMKSSDPDASPVPIIQHPDIKRMLMWMKVYVEGCRALTYFTSYCIDQARITEGGKSSEWHNLMEILIPVVKAYNSDRAWEITSTAIQCAGGYGYCSDYPFERFARDCKITSIYEGTNGIQAMDLIFRKLAGNKLLSFKLLISKIDETIKGAKEIDAIKESAEIVEKAKAALVKTVNDQMALLGEKRVMDVFFKATPFLEVMGDVILGWLHLWQLNISYPKLMSLIQDADDKEKAGIINENRDASFYHGKVSGAQYYIGSILKRVFGKFDQLAVDEAPCINMTEKSFAS